MFWFNIRFGTYHLQWGRTGISFHQNPVQVDWKMNQPHSWKRFAIYQFFGKHLY